MKHVSRSWRKGSTTAHRRARAQVLADNTRRNGGKCQLAIPGVCTGKATTAHHTLGYGVTGDDPRYMVAACAACNGHVGDPRRHDPQPRPRIQW